MARERGGGFCGGMRGGEEEGRGGMAVLFDEGVGERKGLLWCGIRMLSLHVCVVFRSL